MNFKKKNKNNNELDEPKVVRLPAEVKKIPINDEIKALVRLEVSKNFSETMKELTPTAIKIAQFIAIGHTDKEVMESFEIDEQELEYYYQNQSFNAELNRSRYNLGHADKNIRISGQNRLLTDMFNAIITRPDIYDEVPAEKLIDLYFKHSAGLQKQIEGDKPMIQMDVTQIITNNIRDSKRIKEDEKGNIIIESEYKTLEDIADVEENADGIYE